jgi:hypothetical protein
MNLRLDNDDAAAKPLCRIDRFGRGECHLTARDRYAEAREH